MRRPTRTLTLSHCGSELRVMMFGRQGNQGWNAGRIGQLQEILKADGVRTIILPKIPSLESETTRIFRRREFARTRDYFPDPRLDVRNGSVSAGVLFGNQGEAAGMLSHWPIAIFRFCTGRVVVVVCNEHTLLNRKLITGVEKPHCVYASAIHEAVHTVTAPWEFKGVQVFVTLRNSDADQVHRWNDPQNGAYNKVMTQYVAKTFGEGCFTERSLDGGALKLDELILRQLRKWGVPLRQVEFDSLDLAEPQLGEDEESKWCTQLDGLENKNFAVVAIP